MNVRLEAGGSGLATAGDDENDVDRIIATSLIGPTMEVGNEVGEVVGTVTKPMGPSGNKDKDAARKSPGGGGGGGGRFVSAEEAAAAHPSWSAKRKAADEAWGATKPSGKKITFDD